MDTIMTGARYIVATVAASAAVVAFYVVAALALAGATAAPNPAPLAPGERAFVACASEDSCAADYRRGRRGAGWYIVGVRP